MLVDKDRCRLTLGFSEGGTTGQYVALGRSGLQTHKEKKEREKKKQGDRDAQRSGKKLQ